MSVKRLPAEVFPPSEYIRDMIEELCWSYQQFAIMAELKLPEATELADGEISVTPRRALALGKAFGTSATLWYRLQRSYDAGSGGK